jgi:hypothetical protein
MDVDIAPLCETTAIELGANSCSVSSGIVVNRDFPEPTPMQFGPTAVMPLSLRKRRNSCARRALSGPPPSPKPAA